MQILCTLFDSNYLSRALACYESLVGQNCDFHIYLFAFDDLALSILKDLKLDRATVISLNEFEDAELLRVKPGRNVAEYCWTCTPSTIRYVLDKFGHDHCTYIDADTFFYKDPKSIHDAMGENSIVITPHFYSEGYDQTANSGIYCVQYMTFKNNPEGLLALNWWRDACLEWCFARFEDGKFGDQKYLDDWPERFKGVYITQNQGEGVAPWNVQRWNESSFKNVIFYHFHAFKLFENFGYKGFYKFPAWVDQKLYRPYVQKLKEIDLRLQRYEGYKSCFKVSNYKLKMKYLILERLKFRNNIIKY